MSPDDIAMRDKLMAEIARLRGSLQTIADAADFVPADDLRKAARATLTAA